ncbi:tRNA (adenine-N(1)-)-methyltransferase [Aspergillus glaucus CBS 516.65]|uniref:tRNA (adenine(58)-N(1))-methyltransferase catalytic subunit TRM61 n=1 Tax=Aspergillus glaucus CBS 516.65 TaxID=1160497 RepID=A0A1L9VDQ5_ASPGL|nr:hypothetical protein ASPGLDRAFT_49491 [Aspergillus glaucus CBS 516.65]OJJ82091.1 hypothetical protein ASPGLDRAFT_49491 [Aspergillus glaucus CBS 516.65]
MARLLQSLRRVLGLNTSKPALPKFSRSLDTDFSIFRDGDRVIVHGKNPILSKPLRQGHRTDTRRGTLYHDTIIGRRVRDLYPAHKGPEYRLSLPNLDEYVAMTPRLVTPIYAADANLIVSLLDIHVAPHAEGEQPAPLEILESGTGHGSLTLHLARAIQAANSNPPPLPEKSQIQYPPDRPLRPDEDAPKTLRKEQQSDGDAAEDPTQKQWDAWRASRGAVIHTVDVSPKFSVHAERTVRGFRRGIYAGNVDFYVGHVENWIAEQIKQRANASSASTGLLSSLTTRDNTHPDPFLSYAILDMPSAHMRIPHVAQILKRDGFLAVFMPSITQIGECIDIIRQQRLPFVQEKVVELGAGISNGRQWDVRFAVKKSRADPSSWTGTSSSTESDEGGLQQDQEESSSSSNVEEEAPKEEDSVLVCRPKVGTRIVGGGFVGIWRRIEDSARK